MCHLCVMSCPEILYMNRKWRSSQFANIQSYIILFCRRLLESSMMSLSRYDVSGSRDHPIYPDPARWFTVCVCCVNCFSWSCRLAGEVWIMRYCVCHTAGQHCDISDLPAPQCPPNSNMHTQSLSASSDSVSEAHNKVNSWLVSHCWALGNQLLSGIKTDC